jgi:hypothetical protein
MKACVLLAVGNPNFTTKDIMNYQPTTIRLYEGAEETMYFALTSVLV